MVKDTSGEVGLAPALGLIGPLPCVAGLVASPGGAAGLTQAARRGPA